MMKPIHSIQSQKYGVEAEVIGLTRRQAAEAVQSVVGGRVTWLKSPACYDPYRIDAEDGRQWHIKSDSSLKDSCFNERVEIISPILDFKDISIFQECLRRMRSAGARASRYSSCHVHISSEPHTPKSIRNLIKVFNRLELLIYKAVGVQEARLEKYCKPNEQQFVEKISKMRDPSFEKMNRAWFGKFTPEPSRLGSKRYASINLTPLWTIGTIEFRFGEIWPKIHAGKIKAYIVLCLALSAYSLNVSASRMAPLNIDDNPRYSFRSNLLHLGLIGPEYKNVRKHLLANLPGNSAWKSHD